MIAEFDEKVSAVKSEKSIDSSKSHKIGIRNQFKEKFKTIKQEDGEDNG